MRNKLKEEEQQPKEVEEKKDNDDSEKRNDEPTKSKEIEEAVDETASINEDSRSEGMNESDTEKKPDVWQINRIILSLPSKDLQPNIIHVHTVRGDLHT